MNYNLPGEAETIEQVYSNGEMRPGGHFPIGNNNCWHSGIHIFSQKAVRPLTCGQLAAYRINEEYQVQALQKEITGEEYAKCKEYTRRLYGNRNEEADERENKPEETRIYSLEKETLTEAEYAGLTVEMKDLYQKNATGSYIPVLRIVNNFILLKHMTAAYTEGGKESRKIEYYTLYMGLNPGVPDKLKKYYKIFRGFIKMCEHRLSPPR